MKAFLYTSLALMIFEYLVNQLALCDSDLTNGKKLATFVYLGINVGMIAWTVCLLRM